MKPASFDIIVIHDSGKIPVVLSVASSPEMKGDVFILTSEKAESPLTIKCFDYTGKLLALTTTESAETMINLIDLTEGTYFLKVYADSKEVKSFKIIKKQ